MTDQKAVTADEAVESASGTELARYRKLPWYATAWLIIAAIVSMLASIYVIFGLGNQLGTYVPVENSYFYFMIAALLPLPFMIYPSGAITGSLIQRFTTVLAPALALAVPAMLCFELAFPTLAESIGVIGHMALLAVLVAIFAGPYLLRGHDGDEIPLFDRVLALVAFGVSGYFAWSGTEIL